ncbi:unnamed protein product, partial [Ectocarpus sp. 8 AP-2014]
PGATLSLLLSPPFALHPFFPRRSGDLALFTAKPLARNPASRRLTVLSIRRFFSHGSSSTMLLNPKCPIDILPRRAAGGGVFPVFVPPTCGGFSRELFGLLPPPWIFSRDGDDDCNGDRPILGAD